MSTPQRQPWPPETLDYAEIILTQNDLIMLALYVSYFELTSKDNLLMLAGLIPIINERVRDVYEAAVELGPHIESRGSSKPPLWAQQANRIVREYPAVLLRLKDLEVKIRQQRIIEIRWILAELFMIITSIQRQLLKVPMDKKTMILILPMRKINEMSRNLADNKDTSNGSTKLVIREQRGR